MFHRKTLSAFLLFLLVTYLNVGTLCAHPLTTNGLVKNNLLFNKNKKVERISENSAILPILPQQAAITIIQEDDDPLSETLSRLLDNLELVDTKKRVQRSSNCIDTVRRIVAEQAGVEVSDVTLESSVVDDLGMDSLDAVELILAVEEEFNLDIPVEDAEKMKTVGDLVKYLGC